MINKLKNYFFIVIIVFVGILASRDLFKYGYFPMHDDLQMMRQLQLEKCISDGQIPCRWSSDMAYGYGYPLFNFYPPLPYIIGQGFRFLGFAFTDTVKYSFTLSIILSGITMFFFAKKFFGRYAGLISSVFYIWAPYHAVDVYVRGAMNESWALVWFPLIFLSVYELLKDDNHFPKSKPGIVFSFSLFCLLTTHNLMVLIFIPVIALWLILRMLIEKSAIRKYFDFVLYGLWGLGMASFFTIPALFENKFTQVKTQLQGYYDYSAHFISINQMLVSRYWGFGPSLWGVEADRMAFPVGHFHWILSIFVFIALIYLIWKNKSELLKTFKNNITLFTVLFLFLSGWMSAFLIHQKSAFIWQMFPQLRYLQFPWRFLTITIFSFSFIIGFLPYILINHTSRKSLFYRIPVRLLNIILFNSIILILIIFNWNYFKVETIGPVTDDSKFSGLAWELQQTAGIYDYLPVTSKIAPNGPQKQLIDIMKGEVEIKNETQNTYQANFDAQVLTDNAQIRINILDFPNWKIYANNQAIEKYIPKDEMFGRIWFDLPRGDYHIYAQLYNTPVRTYSNLTSLISWFLFIIVFFWQKKISSKNNIKGSVK